MKQRGKANERVNVRLVVHLERFMHVLKGVQAGKDVELLLGIALSSPSLPILKRSTFDDFKIDIKNE